MSTFINIHVFQGPPPLKASETLLTTVTGWTERAERVLNVGERVQSVVLCAVALTGSIAFAFVSVGAKVKEAVRRVRREHDEKKKASYGKGATAVANELEAPYFWGSA